MPHVEFVAWLVCNLDRHEYLHPAAFGEEDMIFDAAGIKTALVHLLTPYAYSPDDVEVDPIEGRWSGNRITIVTEEHGTDLVGLHGPPADIYRWLEAQEHGWVDISEHVVSALLRMYDIFEIQIRAAAHPWHARLPRSRLRHDGVIEPMPTA